MTPNSTPPHSVAPRLLATERHYTPTQLAELWGMSPSKIRELFADEEGVVRFGEPFAPGREAVGSFVLLDADT
jgi:hypothetical protein